MPHTPCNKLFRKLVILLLSVALLFGSSLPLLAASDSGGAGERVLLCTTSGLKWVEINAVQDGDVIESSCPLCRLDDDAGLFPALPGMMTLTLPAVMFMQVALPRVDDTLPLFFVQAWNPGSPRAPPAHA